MSSSSSGSDSDDIEPIRKIKINIKPKDNVAKREGADIEAIKASVEAWRPLGPRPHPSLTRRQTSLSSMSSLSFGTGSNQGGMNSTTATPNSVTSAKANNQYSNYRYGSHQPATGIMAATGLNQGNNSTEAAASTTTTTTNQMRSSPSCSSLVNEFNNRSSFSNFMSSASRTSSPLTFMGGNGVGSGANYSETSVPIALAIQESIELTVRGQQRQQAPVAGVGVGEMKTRFETRALGNIKVAFPNSFARLCSTGASDKPIPALKLRLHSTENIVRYYASRLVKDLDSESSSLAGSVAQDSFATINNNSSSNNNNNNNNINTSASLDNTSCSTSTNGSEHHQELGENNYDRFDMNESPARGKGNTKIIEFDMDALIAQLKLLYGQTPGSRYYNVDVLRYQIMPLDEFEKCPLQVCAYWKVEPKLTKLRVDFKHSNLSGLTLERIREISFTADLSNLVPANLSVQPVSPHLVSTLTTNSHARTASMDNSQYGQTGNLASNDNPKRDSNCNRVQPPTTATPVALFNQLSNSTSFMGQPNGSIQGPPPPQPAPRQINNGKSTMNSGALPIRLPPPPSSGHSRHHHHSRASNLTTQMTGMDTLRMQPSPFMRNQSGSSSGRSDSQSIASGHSTTAETSSILDQLLGLSLDTQRPPQQNVVTPATAVPQLSHSLPPQQNQLRASPTASTRSSTTAATPVVAAPTVPYITYEPQAQWDNQTKQLVWRFDNLLSFYKSDGYGSLLAKLDFRQQPTSGESNASSVGEPQASEQQQQQANPNPIAIKFMVVDSTLSKISLTIDSAGYRMSLLKKEVRSGRYKSEPYIF